MDKNNELISIFDEFEKIFMHTLKNISHSPYVYMPYFEEKLHRMRDLLNDTLILRYEFILLKNTLIYIYYACEDETKDKTKSFDFITCFALMNICDVFEYNLKQYNIKEE